MIDDWMSCHTGICLGCGCSRNGGSGVGGVRLLLRSSNKQDTNEITRSERQRNEHERVTYVLTAIELAYIFRFP